MLKSIIHIIAQSLPIESIMAYIAILVAVGTIAILWRYKKSGEVSFLILIEVSAAVWALTSGLEFMSDDLEVKKLWSQVSYLGISFLPVFYFLFTTAFSQKYHLINPRNLTLLSVLPFVTIILALTNEYHLLLWKNVILNSSYNTLLIEHGIWFWVFWAYSITLIVAGLYNLFLSIYEFTAYYKSQVATLLIATLIPLTGNLMYVTGLNPIPGFDWTPILFVFTGLVITFGIIRYRMFDLVPFARNNLIDTMSDGVIIVNSEGFIEDFNPAVKNIFKLNTKPIIRNKFSLIFEQYNNLVTALESKESSLVIIETVDNQDSKTYQARISPVLDRNREFSGHLIQLNDITSLKQTENQLKLVNKKLEAEVEERGRLIEDLDAFAHTVAHDLRNSLGSIYNISEIIEECIRDENPELLNEFSGHIKSSAKKAMHITHELLLLATVNHHEVEKKPIEMKQVFLNAQNRIKEMVKSSNARISFPEQWPQAVGYAPWVEEIWVNYLSNALKYGGTPPIITVGAESEDYYIRFWIQDNGNGIPPAEQNRLFKKYSRLTPETAEGYGLGLSIVKRIARKLNGLVGVDSSGIKGEGAYFWFELPAVRHHDCEKKTKKIIK